MAKKKSKKSKLKRVRICPQCNSPDVETDFSNHAAVTKGFLNVMKCNNCDHNGTFFPTISTKELKKPKKASQVKNKTITDTTFATGFFNIVFPITSLFFIITGIIMISYNLLTQGTIQLLVGLLILIFYLYRRNKLKQ